MVKLEDGPGTLKWPRRSNLIWPHPGDTPERIALYTGASSG